MRRRAFPLLALGFTAVLLASPELRAGDPTAKAHSAGSDDADQETLIRKVKKTSKNKPSQSVNEKESKSGADRIRGIKADLRGIKKRGGSRSSLGDKKPPVGKGDEADAVPAAAVDLPPEAVAPSGASPNRPLEESSLSEDHTGAAVDDMTGEIQSFRSDLGRREEAGEFEEEPGPSAELLEHVSAGLKPGQSLDPTRPENPAALALSAEMGFREAFRRHGLKPRLRPSGAPAILHDDGTPAAKSELAALRADILREPKALMRHPKLFSIVPRKDFASVKKALAPGAGPAPKDLKDMALSMDARDVLWGRSCSSVSGDCNPHAERKSYAKSEYVRPRTLASAAKASARHRLDHDEIIAKANAKLGRKLGAAKGRGIVSRVKDLIGTLKRKFGFQDNGASPASVSRRGGAAGGGAGAVYAASAGTVTSSRTPGAAGRAASDRSFSEYRAPAAPDSAAGGTPARARRLWPWAAAACLLLILLPLLKRRREN